MLTGRIAPSSLGSNGIPRENKTDRIAMEAWVRAVVEAIHSSRAQAVIYLAGGASQVPPSSSAPPRQLYCKFVLLARFQPFDTSTAAGARLAPVRARRFWQRPRGRRALLQGLHGAAARQGKRTRIPWNSDSFGL